MRNFELDYRTYLQQGRAWSPTWTNTRRSFDKWLVLAPPDVEAIESEADYFALLARRIEWMLNDWLERYGDELPIRVDLDDDDAIKAGTVEMIRQYIPPAVGMGLRDSQSNREIAEAIACREALPTLILPLFPIVLPPREADDEFDYCITKEVTLQGWLIEVRP